MSALDERAELRGSTIENRYRVGAPIGVGGTAVVFEATRLSDGASLVVKTLRPQFAHNADLERRLRREEEVARRVPHPGIVPVRDIGLLEDGSPYIIIERMYSESLAHLLRRQGIIEAEDAIVIGMRLASILHAVHQAGYVHRDIKPEHVLLDRTESGALRVRVLDFGICAAETAPKDERERERGRDYGTPSYVSPEQASGQPYVDGRADVFGVGVTLFEAVTGRLPFTAASVNALLRRIIREDAPKAGHFMVGIPGRFEDVLASMLSRDVASRLPSARALGRALAPLLRDRESVERSLAARLHVASEAPDAVPTVEVAIAAA